MEGLLNALLFLTKALKPKVVVDKDPLVFVGFTKAWTGIRASNIWNTQ